MIPPFTPDGNLPPGIHWANWHEFEQRFGTTAYRQELLGGLKAALDSLKRADCRAVYIDGSFVTAKIVPGDFDACWETTGVNLALLDPALRTFANRRAAQKAKFKGELFPADSAANGQGSTFLEFFQTDRNTSLRKGVVALDPGRLP